MPSIGLGTALSFDKEPFVRGILDAGYVYIDTATAYGNEHIIGEAIQEVFRHGKKR